MSLSKNFRSSRQVKQIIWIQFLLCDNSPFQTYPNGRLVLEERFVAERAYTSTELYLL